MKSNAYTNLLIHSILIYVLCFILNTNIHEGAHAIVAKATGLNPVLHHNYVSTSGNESDPLIVKIMTPAAGPLMSLVQAIIFLILLRTSNQKSLLTLFYLWMSVMGFINIGGYLVLTPMVAYGDTGRVFALLNTPEWLKWIIAVVALLGLMKIIVNFTKDFEKQLPSNLADEGYKPGRLANLLIAYPVYMGCVLTTLISLPVPTFISILYPATSPFITFMIYGRLRRKKENLIGEAKYPEKISLALIAIVIFALVMTRFLVKGVTL